MQEIALAGLNRGGFFWKLRFGGPRAVLVSRFSEDLDFSLLKADPAFRLAPYFAALRQEFAALGFEVEITEKQKTAVTDIASAFLKKSSSLYDINVQGQRALKIKFEVDTDPPQLFLSEQKLLLQPYSFYVNCFALPDLYAGKMHALFFRKWKNRVKGRDWFDFEWYVRRSVTLNLSHFAERARQSGHWQGGALGQEEFLAMLQDRIASLDIASARSDVLPFVREPAGLAIWSKDYFAQLAQRILFA
ncbi:MAG: nucleotidyl transferase AbiEii/AbiGii toxin family protein [Burkholderiales bacterium]|nr:nucleotidyl transferase AbiEii/AbiGii toxin family protein [Burkholderiales bacterium]